MKFKNKKYDQSQHEITIEYDINKKLFIKSHQNFHFNNFLTSVIYSLYDII